jgi:signal transduction histidine kinase
MADVVFVARPNLIPRGPLRALASPYLWLATVHLASDGLVAAVLVGAVLAPLTFALSGVSFVLVSTACWPLAGWLLTPMSAFERARYRLTLGVDIGTPERPTRDRSWVRWTLVVLTSRTMWRQFAYFTLLIPLSMINLAGLFVAWSAPLALLLLPVYDPGFSARHTVIAGFSVGGNATAWVVSGAALVFLLVASPRLVTGLSRGDAAFANALLGPSRTGQLTKRLGQLETSRQQVVDSAAAERLRIERDLHDGAQQRLVSLAMALGRAKPRLPDDLDPVARRLIDEAHQEAKLAITELQDLTRGLHPPVLTDRGLDAALSAVAARAPVPVRLDVRAEPRPSSTVESIAYFVVTEALTNVAKHARATRASVVIRRDSGLLRITVGDDGTGGADPARGSGLRGLADRVSGVDGRLSVASPPGGPTVLTAELPCGS